MIVRRYRNVHNFIDIKKELPCYVTATISPYKVVLLSLDYLLHILSKAFT